MNSNSALACPTSRVVFDHDATLSALRQGRIRFSLLAALIFIAIASVALGWFYRHEPYAATAYLQVKNWNAGSNSEHGYDVFCATQRALLRSPPVVNATLARQSILQMDCLAGRDNPEQWLKDELQVSFPDNSEIMEISLAGSEAQMPEYCRLVDAIIDSYENEVVHKERMEREEVSEFRRAESERMRIELKQKMAELNEIVESLGERDASKSPDVVLRRSEIAGLLESWEELQSKLRDEQFDEKFFRTHLRLLQSATPTRQD